MTEPRQKMFLAIGKEGCLFLSMVNAAEDITKSYIDAFVVYRSLVSNGFLREDCYVNDLSKVFSLLTGQIWECTKEEMSYSCKPNEIEITRYERAGTTATITHFVRTDGEGLVEYDPLSLDLSGWTPAKKYIFRRAI